MSNLDEPMLPANEAMHETRERTIAYDAMAVAGDAEAMKAALKEFIVRLMFEDANHWMTPYNDLLWDAEQDAKREFNAAPIIKGAIYK